MKKIFLTLGTATAAIAPLATVIACGNLGDVVKIELEENKNLKVTEVNVVTNKNTLEDSIKGISNGTPTDAQKAEITKLFNQWKVNIESLHDVIMIEKYDEAKTIELIGNYEGKELEVKFDLSKVMNINFPDDSGNVAAPTPITGDTLKAIRETPFQTFDIGKSWGFPEGTIVQSEKMTRLTAVLAAFQNAEAGGTVVTEINALSLTTTLTSFDSSTADIVATTEAEALSKLGLTAAEYKKITDKFEGNVFTLKELKVAKDSQDLFVHFDVPKNPIFEWSAKPSIIFATS